MICTVRKRGRVSVDATMLSGVKIMAKFVGLLYDEGGNISVETCEAENGDEAYEELERNDSNLMLFTIEEAKIVRDKDEKIKEAKSRKD